MKIEINNIKKFLPDSWNDLTHTELLTIFNLISQHIPTFVFTKDEVPYFLRIEAAKYLLRIDDDFLKKWKDDCAEDGELVFIDELNIVSQTVTSFLFNDKEEVELGLTRNPYTRIGYRSRKRKKYLYGPGDLLSNISLYELGTTFTLFEKYLKDQNDEHLNKLLAVLFRPSKPRTKKNIRSDYNGDRRLPYQGYETTVKWRIPIIKKWPPLVKSLLFFWFSSCRNYIIEGHPNVFKIQPANNLERIGNDYGWGGVLLSLSGGVVNLKAVGDQPWQHGLTYLSFLEDERKLAELRRIRNAR